VEVGITTLFIEGGPLGGWGASASLSILDMGVI